MSNIETHNDFDHELQEYLSGLSAEAFIDKIGNFVFNPYNQSEEPVVVLSVIKDWLAHRKQTW